MNYDTIPETETFRSLRLALEQEGERRGKLEGKLEGERAALLRYLARRRAVLTAAQRAMVDDCQDFATLERWMDAAFATGADDDVVHTVFGELKSSGSCDRRSSGRRGALHDRVSVSEQRQRLRLRACGVARCLARTRILTPAAMRAGPRASPE